MVDIVIRESIKSYLKKVQESGIVVQHGVVFGSQATGRASSLSDIDLLVISPQFDGMRERKYLNLLWHIAAKVDSRIEPIPCGEKQWLEDDSSAIIEIARREGEVVEIGSSRDGGNNQ